jgi:transposase
MGRPKGPAQKLEARRAAAMDLLARGFSPSRVARILSCAPSSVTRWRDAYRRRGRGALIVRKSPGRPPRLAPSERQELRLLLERGARVNGFASDVWTAARVAFLIESRFGVRYHPRHVSRLLRRLVPA